MCPRWGRGGGHLVGQVEAVIGTRELQGLGQRGLPLQAAVHADLPGTGRSAGVVRMGTGREGLGAPSHLVQDYLAILRVPRGQEYLLALFIDLLNAGGQV